MGRCSHSGTIYADPYVEWKYPNGIPIVECPICGARRKLQLVTRKLGRRGSGLYVNKLIYPYHHTVKRPHNRPAIPSGLDD